MNLKTSMLPHIAEAGYSLFLILIFVIYKLYTFLFHVASFL
jgi:hypothetical protein